MTTAPDTTNWSLVGVQGDDVVVLRAQRSMSREQAINLAAWLISIADMIEPDKDTEAEFTELLHAIRAT
jgi:hypothetical protein